MKGTTTRRAQAALGKQLVTGRSFVQVDGVRDDARGRCLERLGRRDAQVGADVSGLDDQSLRPDGVVGEQYEVTRYGHLRQRGAREHRRQESRNRNAIYQSYHLSSLVQVSYTRRPPPHGASAWVTRGRVPWEGTIAQRKQGYPDPRSMVPRALCGRRESLPPRTQVPTRTIACARMASRRATFEWATRIRPALTVGGGGAARPETRSGVARCEPPARSATTRNSA